MSNTFKRVMTTCGISAAMIGAGYLVAGTMAISDGPGGIEIPPEVNLLTAVSVCSAIVLGAAAWLIDTGNRIAAERDLRPIVRTEIERAAPAIASAVLDELATDMDGRVARIADSSAARTAGRLQEIVTGEIMADVINAAINRAHRAGMVLQAQSVTPPKGAVVQMSRFNTDSN